MPAAENDKVMTLPDLLAHHGKSAKPWYALVDAAQHAELPAEVSEAGFQVESLYLGEKGAVHGAVAPYIMEFEPGSDLERVFSQYLGRSLGVILQADATIQELRKHFRRFLIVEDPTGARFRFRFYDPRVLRCFLLASNAEERETFFGPVSGFFCEGRMGKSMHVFQLDGKRMSKVHLPVERLREPRPADAERPKTASLTVVLTDLQSSEPVMNASVQVAGSETHYALSQRGGIAHFARLHAGDYEITSTDPEHRHVRQTVSVKPGRNRVELACRKLA